MNSLQQLNLRWQGYLEDPQAVSLLGLAPMSDEEVSEVRQAVHRFVGLRPDGINRCLEMYPAVTATWIAVAAANEFADGTFFPRLAKGLGFPDYLSSEGQREALTESFLKACRILNRPRTPAYSDTGFRRVREFLFHAGFPVCHSPKLAQAMRSLEREGELPEPSEPDVAEYLCDRLLERLGHLPIPTLLRSLRGSAGPLVAQLAYEVLLSGSYDRLNPHLGEALRKAFEARTVFFSGPRLRPPFLRLNLELDGFEIVCPSQEAQFVAQGRFGWLVNGRLHAWSASDDFLYKVGRDERIEVEASGLSGDTVIARSWEVGQIQKPINEIHLFDADSRRFRKTLPLADQVAELPPGDYWVVVPREIQSSDANQDLSWPDAVVLHVTVRPGQTIVLDSLTDKQFSLIARMAPVLLAHSSSTALPDAGEKLLLDDSVRLEAWFPASSSGWLLKVACSDREVTLSCDQAQVVSENWTAVTVDVSPHLKNLTPGLHEIECSLLKNGNVTAKRSFLFWAGCPRQREDGGFTWTARPANLEQPECVGFEQVADGVVVCQSTSPFRSLKFRLKDGFRESRWRNPGLFIELIQRRPGHVAETSSHPLGITIPASVDSDIWLRIWYDGKYPPRFRVNGTDDGRQMGLRGFVEFPLADLAVHHAQGGDIQAEIDSLTTLIARFASPLVPISINKLSGEEYRSLDFTFNQRLQKVCPVCIDLIHRRSITFKPMTFSSLGYAEFKTNDHGLPRIRIRNFRKVDNCTRTGGLTSIGSLLDSALSVTSPKTDQDVSRMTIGLDISTRGWPDGFWVVMLQAARSPNDLCEVVPGPDRKAALLLVAVKPDATSSELQKLLSAAWQATLVNRQSPWLQWNWTAELLASATDFLDVVQAMFAAGFTDRLATDFSWVALLERAVAAEAERRLRAGDVTAPKVLLDIARSNAGRSRLLRIPEVMAFPASSYAQLVEHDALIVALRQCSEICAFDWLSEFIVESPAAYSEEFLRNFSNYAEIKKDGATDELATFDVIAYWNQLENSRIPLADFDPGQRRDLLGESHWRWTWVQFVKRLSEQHGDTLGLMNACAHQAAPLLQFVRAWTEKRHLVPRQAWSRPWPQIQDSTDFSENMPRFCSAFALAARSAGEGQLSFPEALKVLVADTPQSSLEAGLRALLQLAPEMFGFFLLFWQTLIKTSPHHD